MDLNKHLTEIVPYRIGSRVKIAPDHKYANEWRNVYVVVGMRWEYQKGPRVNIEIASDEDIQGGYGATDGFSVTDLVPA